MATYAVCGAIVISASFIERRARENGNLTGALAAQRFGRFFLLGAGGWLAWEWIAGMIALLA